MRKRFGILSLVINIFLLAVIFACLVYLRTILKSAEEQKERLKETVSEPSKGEIAKEAISYYNKGAVCVEKAEYQEAISFFKEALKIAPKEKTVKQSLSTVLVKIGSDYMQKRDYKNAESAFNEALSYNQDNADAYILLGDIRYNSQDLDGAKEYWQKAETLSPASQLIKDRCSILEKQYEKEKEFESNEYWSFTVAFESSLKTIDSYGMRSILWKAYREIGQDFGCFPTSTITVIFYPHQEYMKMTGYGEPVRGHYDGKIRIPFLENEAELKAYEPVIRHEYTHAVISILCPKGVPIWLNEGLAQYEENCTRPVDTKLLIKALKKDSLFSINELDKFLLAHDKPDKATLAYQESFSLIDYIIHRYGFFVVRNAILELSKGQKAFTDILKEVLYVGTKRLEKDWVAYATKKYL